MDCIERVTDQATSPLVHRGAPPAAAQNGRVVQAEGGQSEEVAAEERMMSGQVLFFWREGSSRGFIVQMASLVLIGEFQIDSLRITFLEEVEVTI